MYDIRQFRPTLYLLVWLGILGYAMAATSPGFFLLPTMLLALNVWLIRTNRFTPMPRWVANLATILSLLWASTETFGSRHDTILVIGEFLIFLQLVKLYEQRANRDYAQLLVLSLLLMVAASINTASLLFGILLIIYLFISLYCCLLFHLKVETEQARQNMALPDSPRSENTLRQDQQDLSKSMRRVVGLVAGASILAAIVVFLLFPRGMGAGVLGPIDFRQTQTMTGFSDQVSFQRIAAITQSQELVAYVSVTKNGRAVSGVEPLLLRGETFDIYNGNNEDAGKWQWARSKWLHGQDSGANPKHGVWISNLFGGGEDVYKQVIMLKPTGTPAIFAMAGTYECDTPDSNIDLAIRQNVHDELLMAGQAIQQTTNYTVYSRGYVVDKKAPSPLWEELWSTVRGSLESAPEELRPPEGWNERRFIGHFPRASQIDPSIAAYARKPEVTNGLAARRDPTVAVSPLDEKIAEAIEHHLQTEFTYTLDLTDAKMLDGQDPVAWFLSPDGHRGHCEYFAGAMTLLCQSLGMQARLVAGFKCDNYNPISKQYEVLQSHAHAWVEVLTKNGWRVFDPTSGRETPQPTAIASFWQTAKHVFSYVEFAWAKNVVAYGNDDRKSLLTDLNSRLSTSVGAGNSVIQTAQNWIQNIKDFLVSSAIITSLMGLMTVVLIGAIAFYAYERWRMRRRAARIGLDGLSSSDQLQMAKQLGFYDDLILLLERHQIQRSPHLTPQEFADSLSHLPANVFITVRRLTALFYLIRYGRRRMTGPRQKLLASVIQRLADVMQPPPAAT